MDHRRAFVISWLVTGLNFHDAPVRIRLFQPTLKWPSVYLTPYDSGVRMDLIWWGKTLSRAMKRALGLNSLNVNPICKIDLIQLMKHWNQVKSVPIPSPLGPWVWLLSSPSSFSDVACSNWNKCINSINFWTSTVNFPIDFQRFCFKSTDSPSSVSVHELNGKMEVRELRRFDQLDPSLCTSGAHAQRKLPPVPSSCIASKTRRF